MFRPRVIPTLLLKEKGLVKTVNFKNPKYIGDPINAVRIFNDLEADELIFLDIDATLEGRTISSSLVKTIGDEAYMPFSVGGGIRTLEQAHGLISAGAEKIVLNTAAVDNPDIIREIAEVFGSQSVVVSVDVKKNLFGKYVPCAASGTNGIGFALTEHLKKAAVLGAGEVLINSISRDGRMQGYDIELIKRVSSIVDIPVIACGGAGTVTDFVSAVNEGGASAVAAGSLFVFHGPRKAVLINYPEKEELEVLFNNSG
jgi:cyclase